MAIPISSNVRAYILTLHNMVSMEDCQSITNEETLLNKNLSHDRLQSYKVKAAFPSLVDAVNQLADILQEMEEDFEQNNHFINDEKSRISVSLDIVELSENDFNEINAAKREGQFFVHNMPIDCVENES